MRFILRTIAALVFVSLASCGAAEPAAAQPEATNSRSESFDRLTPEFSLLVPQDAVVEKVAGGFEFTEGPVWLSGDPGALLFSDIPANTIYRWTEDKGTSVFLQPVMTDDSDAGGVGGSNGLALGPEGRLILCEHGNRRVARFETDGSRTTLADRYENGRLNSPNDIAFHSSGAAFFTDPPYGLVGQDDSPVKEQAQNGVYRLDRDGTVTLVAADQTRPNGIGLSPDEQVLYVANSDDPPRQHWMFYPVLDDLTLGEGRVFFDANELVGRGRPDGLALDEFGNVYATGPGGILVLDANGQHLGTIMLEETPTNVGWGDDGKTLYITAHSSVYRVRLNVEGLLY